MYYFVGSSGLRASDILVSGKRRRGGEGTRSVSVILSSYLMKGGGRSPSSILSKIVYGADGGIWDSLLTGISLYHTASTAFFINRTALRHLNERSDLHASSKENHTLIHSSVDASRGLRQLADLCVPNMRPTTAIRLYAD